MAEPTLYLFDGSNLFHAGGYPERRVLVDELASFVALKGARGIVVFDGVGEEQEIGPLAVRYAAHADTLLERLAAEHLRSEEVCLVSSDFTLRSAADLRVDKRAADRFLAELPASGHSEDAASRVRDRIDDETRAKLERLRRGEDV
jgi:predicted RNA-binding protein with PIN domain